jgi:nicotinamide phosphoribosyltransferase
MTCENYLLMVDSYKLTHFRQYPKGTKYLRSYIESRGGKYSETVFFGLQMFLKKTISRPVTLEMIEEAHDFAKLHGFAENFNVEGWTDIATRLKGKLPLKIMAPKEGMVIPVKNALAIIENTDPKHAWLVSWIETMLLRAIWYPVTVASRSYHLKKLILKYLHATADEPMKEIDFKLHDFGARGVSSGESAEIGGLAHLVNFKGTDTMEALWAARKYYDERMAGFSIPASEHSTITSWGKENESKAYANMIDQFSKPGKIFACVSDSYDLWNAIDNIWGDELKLKLIESGGTLVVRPDSGNPAEVVLETIKRLEKKFGSKLNSKGYSVLHDCVRVIQGDGINDESIVEILELLKKNKYSASNIAFGMGGGLLQQLDRDTLKFANKTCYGEFEDGETRNIFKDPITDPGKTSKSGKLNLFSVNGKMMTVDEREMQPALLNSTLLDVAYFNGHIARTQTLAEVRKLAEEGLASWM